MSDDYTPSGVFLSAVEVGFSVHAAHDLAHIAREAHAAGVAEGIRQAREAVENSGPLHSWSHHLAAIDAL